MDQIGKVVAADHKPRATRSGKTPRKRCVGPATAKRHAEAQMTKRKPQHKVMKDQGRGSDGSDGGGLVKNER
jgi:hypothetical protein